MTPHATPRTVRGTSAQEVITAVLDYGSFARWDVPTDYSSYLAPYREELQRACEQSGADEAVITGEGQIGGRRVAVAISEFGFLAGSIGLATANRLVQLFERATAEGLPVLASPASGGTRMQEGTPAFVAMVKITAAVRRHKQAGLPYLVYLRHPTTGGVMASWGSLSHITVAGPHALLGFLGPRVYEAIYGEQFPKGIQLSGNLQAQDSSTPSFRWMSSHQQCSEHCRYWTAAPNRRRPIPPRNLQPSSRPDELPCPLGTPFRPPAIRGVLACDTC